MRAQEEQSNDGSHKYIKVTGTGIVTGMQLSSINQKEQQNRFTIRVARRNQNYKHAKSSEADFIFLASKIIFRKQS